MGGRREAGTHTHKDTVWRGSNGLVELKHVQCPVVTLSK